MNLPQVLAAFEALPGIMTNQAAKAAVTDALAPLMAAYKANLSLHRTSGAAMIRDRATGAYKPRPHLADTPTMKTWRFPDGDGYAGLMGPKANTAPHAHLIESGTVHRFRIPRIWFNKFKGGGTSHGKGGIAGKYVIVEIMIQAGKKAPSLRSTGTMPAFEPLAWAVANTRTTVAAILRSTYSRELLARVRGME